MVWAEAVRTTGALKMSPPAIDALFNSIVRREVLPAGPVVDFDTAYLLGVQVGSSFLRKPSFRFLVAIASLNCSPRAREARVEEDTM